MPAPPAPEIADATSSLAELRQRLAERLDGHWNQDDFQLPGDATLTLQLRAETLDGEPARGSGRPRVVLRQLAFVSRHADEALRAVHALRQLALAGGVQLDVDHRADRRLAGALSVGAVYGWQGAYMPEPVPVRMAEEWWCRAADGQHRRSDSAHAKVELLVDPGHGEQLPAAGPHPRRQIVDAHELVAWSEVVSQRRRRAESRQRCELLARGAMLGASPAAVLLDH